MKVNKSSRHSKITGDFAESLVLYWLSKYGFEAAKVDHTGIDLIAKNSITNELMGISVKSRSRNEGKEDQYVSISNDNFDKIDFACKAFNCVPYFAIVVDQGKYLRMFIVSMQKLLQLYPKGKTCSGWKMTKKHVEQYKKDNEIFVVELEHETISWWN